MSQVLKIYGYKKCSTCRDALKYLDQRGLDYESIEIREQPPTVAELRKMLKYVDGNIKKLFNSSGMDYRALKLKDKLPSMSETQKLELLHSNGNLIKRPFILGKDKGTVGFKPDVWDELFIN